MSPIKRRISEAVQTLTDAVQPGDLELLIRSIHNATGVPLVLLDRSYVRIAAAGLDGSLAEMVWPAEAADIPGIIAEHIKGLEEQQPQEWQAPLGAGATLLLCPVTDEERYLGVLTAGPVVKKGQTDEFAEGDADTLATALGVDASAVRERLEASVTVDEADLERLGTLLKGTALATSLLFRYGRDLRRRTAELDAIYDIGATLTATLDLARLLDQVLETAIMQAGARKGSVMLLNETREYLTIAKARGLSEEIVAETKVPMGEGISGWVAQENKPRIMLKGVRDLLSRSPRPREEMTAALSVPIRARGHVIGVINVSDCTHADNFDEEDLRILQMLAVPAGVALDNARTYGTSGR